MPKDKQVSTLLQLGRATSGTFNILNVCVCVRAHACTHLCVLLDIIENYQERIKEYLVTHIPIAQFNKTSVYFSVFAKIHYWKPSKELSFLSYPSPKAISFAREFSVFTYIKCLMPPAFVVWFFFCSCFVQPETLEPVQSPDFGSCLIPLRPYVSIF